MEIMDSGVQLTFLWRLVSATQSNQVDWEAVSPGSYGFRCRIGRFGYVVFSRDQDDLAPFVLDIFKFADKTDKGAPAKVSSWDSEEMSSINDALQALYIEAKRRVLGYDSLVTDMFEDLTELDGGPADDQGF